jgi:hypothetical protein
MSEPSTTDEREVWEVLLDRILAERAVRALTVAAESWRDRALKAEAKVAELGEPNAELDPDAIREHTYPCQDCDGGCEVCDG